MKVLNLYAGIGGNRKLWKDVEVTAVEHNEEIAQIYKDFFQDDEVIIGDAHQYLLEHYGEFDFIWSSPPCPTHSDIRRMGVDIGIHEPVYPDMALYQEVILLRHFCKCRWLIENVVSYYKPLIHPQKIDRHYYWANFLVSPTKKQKKNDLIKRGNVSELQEHHNIDISKYPIKDKRRIMRNCVEPRLGLHVFNCAFKEVQQTIGDNLTIK